MSSDKIVSLRGGPVPEVPSKEGVVESVIEGLKELLELAEAGELRGMVCSLHLEGGRMGHCFVGQMKYYEALGGLENVKLEFAASVNDGIGSD